MKIRCAAPDLQEKLLEKQTPPNIFSYIVNCRSILSLKTKEYEFKLTLSLYVISCLPPQKC